MLFYLDSYLGLTRRTDARYNVLRGNVACLPSCIIAAAQCDPLCDDSSALFDAMQANGIAQAKDLSGVLHGFIHYSRILDLATEALRDGATALREFRPELRRSLSRILLAHRKNPLHLPDDRFSIIAINDN